MNASEDGTHSRALLDPRDAALQISDAEQDMIEISRHIVLRKKTWGRNHDRPSQSEKHSSRQQRGRTEADYPISLVFRHGTFGHGAWDMRHCINAVLGPICKSAILATGNWRAKSGFSASPPVGFVGNTPACLLASL